MAVEDLLDSGVRPGEVPELLVISNRELRSWGDHGARPDDEGQRPNERVGGTGNAKHASRELPCVNRDVRRQVSTGLLGSRTRRAETQCTYTGTEAAQVVYES